jgi:hypothetical protein
MDAGMQSTYWMHEVQRMGCGCTYRDSRKFMEAGFIWDQFFVIHVAILLF